MAAMHRVNVQLTDSQMKVMMRESSASGLRIGTLLRMMLHDDIAAGRATKFQRRAAAERKSQDLARRLLNAVEGVNTPE